MSLDALRTALALERPDPSWGRTHKAVLECLGDHANAAGEAFVCVATICDEKWIDRKAVMKAIGDLRTAGWIVDTGKRRGRTGQVIVWELPWIEHRNKASRNRDTYLDRRTGLHGPIAASQQPQGLQPEPTDTHRPEYPNSPESGTVSERVPVSDGKGPGLTRKESPNRDTEPSTRLNPPPEKNPLAEGDGRASAPAPTRQPKTEKPTGQRGKRMIPADWQPQPALAKRLAEQYPAIPIELELEKFRDHWRADGRRFSDLDAAFRNWIRKAAEFAERDGKGRQQAGVGSRKVLN